MVRPGLALLSAMSACSPKAPPAQGCPVATLSLTGDQLLIEAGDCGSYEATARVLGSGDLSVLLQAEGEAGFSALVEGEGEVEAVVLEGSWSLPGTADPVLWRQGYQSWSWSGVVPLEPATIDEDGLPAAGGDGDAFSLVNETPWSSWWGALVGREDGGSLHLGALDATDVPTWFAADEDRLFVVWGHRGDRWPVSADSPFATPSVEARLGPDANLLWEDWADDVAEGAGLTLPAPPPTGWATWYQLYSGVTEADVRANLDEAVALNARLDLADIEVFQIDDGWQVVWGEWTAGDDFPSGMATLASDISDAGFTPGLWMAPFYVDRSTSTYQAHPDWWVRDLEGEEIRFTNLGSGDYAIIDVTVPEAGAWMAEQVGARAREGWTYLKLDFLYAGAQPGLRHEAVSGLEAYAIGLDLLRNAAGDAWILACGAPMLPSVGFAQQFRSGADIAFEISPDPDPDYLRWAARSTAARGFANGRWWWNDPDQLLLREPTSEILATGALAAQVVSGGPWMLGDDLTTLPADRLALALDPELVALSGQRLRPGTPLHWTSGLDAGPVVESATPDDQAPTSFTLEDGTTVLLNLGSEEVEAQGPGGTELLSGANADPGPRTLAPGAGEIWR